ncbi:MAG: Prolipoprotein diacylglyceryl transferase [Microgenomates group bacterium GW2011_GWC1_41_8]|uniref:Prolipoprotein diacylglyceryl transferase n=2 Tax=Candidatus Roizmaniibacteriota TaxID=1752723 RepID=A0A0G0WA30_9BACT|nr:MAG: Prolipoprotein diacylglyceryl transferase [Candidatus Levybacteria bacterium GW2011_GWA2_40_16]KKR72072.1 MAG: Prolipoprotein diacylglyceryl transferase [Candidatus Roizmanbacteria bacterium GW2011_GWB1_40_7]KKR94379.1 MAG: Prolipoprotein diacylglyceryl transferase [Candidatus Roizmanbacteria bacterium GW2011_GWA1_41_13]KKS24452.1 MAG: Prolipoprotein diacylglyceryl transferase [Microgenomates group bacterium GW2011_GWC1_41_8]OGK47954.1 MAG: hypothetical protein A3A55_02610 [Candidatus R
MLPTLFFFTTLAVLVSIFVIWKQAKEKLYSESELFDTIIFMILAAIGGARMSYILIHFNEFSFHLLRWIAFWVTPGFYLFGGAVGILFVLWYQSRQRRDLKFWEMVDFVGFAFWIGAIIGLFGGFLAGSEAGIVSGVSAATHPVTLYKLLVLLAFLSPYVAFRNGHQREDWFHKTPGSVGLSIALLFAVTVVFVDFFKERVLYYRLSLDQWVSLVIGITSFVVLYYRLGRNPNRDITSISRLLKKLKRTA